MAHFDLLRPSGFWTYQTPISHLELEQFDIRQSKSINGDDGGVWNPADVIEIGGLGIKLTGLAEFIAGIEVSGTALFHDSLLAESTLAIAGPPAPGYQLTVTGTTKLTGGLSGVDFGFTGDGSVMGNLLVNTELRIAGAAAPGYQLTVNGLTKMTGALSGADFGFTGDGSVMGNLLVNTALRIAGAAAPGYVLAVNGSGKVTANLLVVGDLDVSGSATITGLTVLNGATTVNDNANITGDLTVGGLLKGKGPVAARTLTLGNANAVVSVTDYDEVFVPPSVLSADRTVTIDAAGAVEGSRMRVFTNESARFANVYIPTSGASLAIRDALGDYWFADLRFVGGAWRFAGTGKQLLSAVFKNEVATGRLAAVAKNRARCPGASLFELH